MSAKLVGGIHVDHPRGEPTKVFLCIDRGLKGGRLDDVPLTEDDLLGLLEDAARVLRMLRRRGP